MAEHLTFKQYLDSKQALREAIKLTPKQIKKYTVNRYCTFVIGESKDERQTINLKPNVVLTINWLYEQLENPSAQNVSFAGIDDIDPFNESTPAWTSQKIQKWLIRNTREEYSI